ncbi:MAG TPA: DUF465 domain-containing protein [Burkholderiales bacterium]|nr:DUF465 domain-containing protein [Burkholderiales bacterium]
MGSEEIEAIKARIRELQVEHRDLDAVIARLADTSYPDQLQLRRLKKRKLLLKDMITKLEMSLVPDIPA